MPANIINNLITPIYNALDTVPRELIGMIHAVRRWPSNVRVAANQVITFPIVPKMTMTPFVPTATAGPNPAGITVGNDTMSMTDLWSVPFPWTGEEAAGLDSSGLFAPILQDEFAQAFRAIANKIEADLVAMAIYASRAWGTAGSLPFNTVDQMVDLTETKKILKDNGAPQGDLSLVMNTSVHAWLQGMQPTLWKAQEYGNREGLVDGNVPRLMGVNLHESGQLGAHTSSIPAGSAADGTLAAFPAATPGATVVGIIAPTQPFVAGDVAQFGVVTDPWYADKYVVKSFDAVTGLLTLNSPGLTVNAGAGITPGVAITIAKSFGTNLMMDRSAICLISALPNLPPGGDVAVDNKLVVDPVSGIQFDISVYKQYGQNSWDVRSAWGIKVVKSDFLSLLLS